MSSIDGHDDRKGAVQSRAPLWLQNAMNKIFGLRAKGVTIESEVYCGMVQFVSNLFVLPVIPLQLRRIGYSEEASIAATAIASCVGCILSGVLTDLPFIIAPPTAVSIFFAASLQQQGIPPVVGNAAIMISGGMFALIGLFPPATRFIGKFIPENIQAATAIGISLMIALAGALEIKLVVPGKYTLIDMGPITDEVVISISALILIAALLHYQVKGAFCVGLIFGTLMWWFTTGSYPSAILANPVIEASKGTFSGDHQQILLLFNLVFLYTLFMMGLSRSLADIGHLTLPDGSAPKKQWLIFISGLTTVLSGFLTGPPILLSPESAAGLKAGAKTGLSTVVCGILFGISAFFWPVFYAVPPAGTAPLLLFVGVLLFNNTRRVDWTDMKTAVPAFIVVCFIPFSYSILRGIAFGYVIHFFMLLFTGEYITNAYALWDFYANPKNYTWGNIPKLLTGGPLVDIQREDRNETSVDVAYFSGESHHNPIFGPLSGTPVPTSFNNEDDCGESTASRGTSINVTVT